MIDLFQFLLVQNLERPAFAVGSVFLVTFRFICELLGEIMRPHLLPHLEQY